MWKDFRNFHHVNCKILMFWSDNLFFGPPKEGVAALHKVTFVWKNVQNGGASLDSYFKASWLHAWKILDH